MRKATDASLGLPARARAPAASLPGALRRCSWERGPGRPRTCTVRVLHRPLKLILSTLILSVVCILAGLQPADAVSLVSLALHTQPSACCSTICSRGRSRTQSSWRRWCGENRRADPSSLHTLRNTTLPFPGISRPVAAAIRCHPPFALTSHASRAAPLVFRGCRLSPISSGLGAAHGDDHGLLNPAGVPSSRAQGAAPPRRGLLVRARPCAPHPSLDVSPAPSSPSLLPLPRTRQRAQATPL